MNSNFWENKKVLITGHTGFKGTWLAYILSLLGANLTGISIDRHKGIYSETNASDLFEKEYFLDIRSFTKEFSEEINEENFDIIFHLAAQSLVHEAHLSPLNTIETNILGTYNILELFNNSKSAKTLSISTTDKVYKDPSSINTEEYELGGHEFYSASKVSKENVINAYINTKLDSKKNISVIRSGNVIGGGDRSDNRLVPDIINSVSSEQNVSIRNPQSIRPWQHVLDSLGGYLLATEYSYENKISEVFNLNSDLNSKFTVNDISQKIIDKWESKSTIEKVGSDVYEVDTLTINSEKAERLLNWKSKYFIDEIITLIVDWEKSPNKTEITKKQVLNFLE